MECFYCGHEFGDGSHELVSRNAPLAFDPNLGRLWRVCPTCRRWSATPIEDRWERLEACERAASAARAVVLLETRNLAMLRTRAGAVIRVGGPPRDELARWRYSDMLDSFTAPRGWRGRLMRMPAAPVLDYIGGDYHGGVATVPMHWIGSPFIGAASLLTALFTSAPLAPACTSCRAPLFIAPHRFGDVRLTIDASNAALVANCALCGAEVLVDLAAARPAIRLGLASVSGQHRASEKVGSAVKPIDGAGGAAPFIHELARRDLALGMLSAKRRLALWISLDESAEADALEAEWRRAEELAAISDGELTRVPGFVEFRARVLGG